MTIRGVFLGIAMLAGILVGSLMGAPVAQALTAEEMLADPSQEARARDISRQVRCLVCQNQSIDDSDAELAKDLRVDIRRQITAGVNNDDILDNLRATYGDYVLLNPPISPGTYILWGAPLVILLAGVGVLVANRRRLQQQPDDIDTQNSADEESNQPAKTKTSGDQENTPMSRVMLVMLGCGVIGLSLLVYLMLGRPDLADQPLADRRTEIAASLAAQSDAFANQQEQLATARNAVKTAPEKVESWLQLAAAASQANDSDTEIAALRQVLELTNGDANVKALLAEALSRAADGQITVPARQLIAEALVARPDEPRALYMAGLAAYQDEDFIKAVSLWQRLRLVSVSDAPWMALLGDNIADAAAKAGIAAPSAPNRDIDSDRTAPAAGMAISQTGGSTGPSAADMAAAAEMNADDRLAMIEDMVAGLAQRLKDDPQNPDGWQRLARAYDVLGRPQQAAAALIGAADAVESDADAQIAALEYIITNGIEPAHQTAANRLLTRLDKIMPDGLERLFFRGHFAKVEGDNIAAKQFWQILLDRLPQDTPFASELKTEIADL